MNRPRRLHGYDRIGGHVRLPRPVVPRGMDKLWYTQSGAVRRSSPRGVLIFGRRRPHENT